MKYALITGANSEIAKTVVFAFKDKYHFLLVDMNSKLEETYKDLNAKTIFCGDLTDELFIESIKSSIDNITNKIYVIIHFAGLLEIGPLIEVPLNKFEKLMAVNLFAIYAINQAFFPHLKEAKGRIIHLSSEYGFLLSLPFHSFYTMSKRALEAYNDSLRRELSLFGIKVIKIRPGAIKTSMQAHVTQKFNETLKNTTYYEAPLTKMQKMMLNELKRAKAPCFLIKTFNHALSKRKPRIVYNVFQSKRMKILNRLSPRTQDYILRKFF